nr:hypothetical protein [Pseudoscardovia radai]
MVAAAGVAGALDVADATLGISASAAGGCATVLVGVGVVDAGAVGDGDVDAGAGIGAAFAAGAACDTGAPQFVQNFSSGAIGSPHCGQFMDIPASLR